jgi:Holliday junction resolvasome RuvABC ATP-dependent DNA helicase subunit
MTGIPEALTTAPRHLFFTGKGGVGKTPLACASVLKMKATKRLTKTNCTTKKAPKPFKA